MTTDRQTLPTLTIQDQKFHFFPLSSAPGANLAKIQRLPYSIRILLEAVIRKQSSGLTSITDISNLLEWQSQSDNRPTIPIIPGRVVLQDFTGVPVVNDLAAMRSALVRLGGEPAKINPVVPVDLVIDHSVQVDYAGSADAFQRNAEIEFERNRERYEFLHWAQKAFANFKVVPPASGIVHQVNLEHLATVVLKQNFGATMVVYPDTLVGTDSHTTMINGLGVVGWGVGGIEAVAAMLGEPIEIVAPDVIGVRLSGKLPEGVTPTDLTLTIIQKLRKLGVVDKFVEFYGSGLDHLSLADRAMIANMTPECGATMLYFPVDHLTLDYLRLSGRAPDLVELVETYFKTQSMYRTSSDPDPDYSQVVEVDLDTIEPSLAGPKRPQDRVPLKSVPENFHQALIAPKNQNGFGIPSEDVLKTVPIGGNGHTGVLTHGSVVIAAITSCTNTSNPFVMLSAGLLAKKAVEKGLQVNPLVKTSLAPGSKVVTDYLVEAGLMDPLEKLGFHLVGYGCTTCIGNSGPLPQPIIDAIKENNLVVGAVLSGNRNFEGRVSPHTRANYLASPPLVVAYALAGTLDINLTTDPIGHDQSGNPVFLRDIWPSSHEVQALISQYIKPELYARSYAGLYEMSDQWNLISSEEEKLYTWDPESTYLQEPPFLKNIQPSRGGVKDIEGARILAFVGDSITTDHISPAGSIQVNSPAGEYLLAHNVQPSDFNSYGSRRGNDRIMTRGTFANIRLKNNLVPGIEGGYTKLLPSGEQMTIFAASEQYAKLGIPLILIAGKEYGSGSSRDWAAKGPLLLGVKAVIAESFERIHRSNLAEMGILPLQFLNGQSATSLELDGTEEYSIEFLQDNLFPGSEITVSAVHSSGKETRFKTILRLDTTNEVTYYRNGGIMNTILLKFLS